MSYLLDKQLKRKKNTTLVIVAIVFVVVFYFRVGIFHGLSYVASVVFHPFLALKNGVSTKFENFSTYLDSKDSLHKQIEDLESKRADDEARMANYNTVLAENERLKEILNRKDANKALVLAVILGKDNQSLYDTLIIDVGIAEGIALGAKVFALGNIPIGYVAEVHERTSKIVLFSNSEEVTSVVLGDTLFDLVGRGGGNFELVLPRDFVLEIGEQVVLPGILPHVVAVVSDIISDPRDAVKKALLISPVNTRVLKFVQVEAI